MNMPVIALVFLLAAIILGFVKKMNVGLVCLGLAFILGQIGKVPTRTILGGFPSSLFLTLLGTMFFFSLLQENNTLELLSKKMVSLIGSKTFLIPVIIYAVSFLLSAAGPGAISVQAVMIIFAVSLAVQMDASPILMGGMAILGAVGGTASPIALTGILVRDLTAGTSISDLAMPVFIGVSVVNFICAIVLYVVYGGFNLKSDKAISTGELPTLNNAQKLCSLALIAMIILVVGFQFDVGLICFMLALILMLAGVVNEKAAMKLVPWSVLILICGVNVLMTITKTLGGIDLLASILASMMNDTTATPIIGLTAGIMSWFSSANGVVFPTLIPTVPDIVANVGGNVTALQMIVSIVASACVAGISPLSTGGSLVLASYTQGTNASEKEQASIFAKLFGTSFMVVMVVVIFAFVGGFKLFS